MVLVYLEKAFDRAPRKVFWWALRKLGVEEWIVRLVKGMYYANARGQVRVGELFSQEFEVKDRVHHGSVLTPCSSSLCWRHCQVSFGLVFPGKTLSSLLAP